MDFCEDLKPTDVISGDRRADRRYEMRLELRWKLVRRRRVLESGTGYTVDLSSGGILIEAGKHLPAGLNLELSDLVAGPTAQCGRDATRGLRPDRPQRRFPDCSAHGPA